MKKTYYEQLIFIGVSFVVFYLYWLVNRTHNMGRFILPLDEQLVFDGVRRILDSKSFDEFILNISGPDQRYGRVLWYWGALWSYLPYKISGVKGLIFGYRMGLVFIFTIGNWFLVHALLNSFSARILGFLALFILPGNVFLMTFPKIEVFVFCSLAFALWVRVQFKNKNQFLVPLSIGVSYGTKISVLPASFAFVIKDYLDQRKINHKYFIILAVGFLLVVPGFILFSAHDYFNVTYGYITHGDEDITITPISWFNLWKNNYFPGSIGSLFLISLVGLIMILLYRNYKQFRNPFLLLKNQLFFSVMIGLSQLLPPFTLKRLSGFYLFVGMNILLICFSRYLEIIFVSKNKIKICCGLFWVGICVGLFSLYYWPEARNQYQYYGHREQQTEYLSQMKKRQIALDFIANSKGRSILFDVGFYDLELPEEYIIFPIYGEFTNWDLKPQIIVIRSSLCQEESGIMPPVTSVAFNGCRIARKKHIQQIKDNYQLKVVFDDLHIYERITL